MKTSIIGLLKINVNPAAVAIQLCLALADLALQLTEWKGVVEEMFGEFGQSAEFVPILLEFLKVLPEELSDPRRTMLSDEEFRSRTEELLETNSRQVIQLLANFLQTPESEGKRSLVFECLNSWLREISVDEVVNSPLLDMIFEALAHDETFDAAVECVVSAIRETRDVTDSADAIGKLYVKVMQLRPRIAETKDDVDAFRGITRIFAEAGDSWHVLVARHPDQFGDLVDAILECTTNKEELDIVRHTFFFWYQLKQMVVLERFAAARQAFAPRYLKLISIIIGHLEYPSGDGADLFGGNREEEDTFREFRHEIGDVLKDCCSVIGASNALQVPYELLGSLLQRKAANDSTVTWQHIEAPLFSMRAMGREVDMYEDEIMPRVMGLIPQLPEHEKIRYAATLVLGRYTEWTNKHPEFLEMQMNYVTTSFNNENVEVRRAAALALMHFCQDCRAHLAGFIDQLGSFYQNLGDELDPDSYREVTEGIAYVILAQPLEKVQPALQHFTKPILERLVGSAQKPTGDEELEKRVADDLELLSIFIKIVRPNRIPEGAEHPMAKYVADVFPVIVTVLNAHGASLYVAERSSKLIKTSLHSSGVHLAPLLPSIANTLVAEFEKSHYGSYLWASGAVLREFADEIDTPVPEETLEAIWQFSYRQCASFFVYLSSLGSPNDVPDLIEDFYRFSGDVLMFFPYRLITSNLFEPMFNAAMVALSLEAYDPLMATLHFLHDLFAYGKESPPNSAIKGPVPENIRQLIAKLALSQGVRLTKQIFVGLISEFPKDCIFDATSLLMAVFQLVPPASPLEWLSATLDEFPQGTVAAEEKQTLTQRVSVALQSGDYRRIRSLVRDFTNLYYRRHIASRGGKKLLRGINGGSFSFHST